MATMNSDRIIDHDKTETFSSWRTAMAGQAITRALTASFGAMNSDNGGAFPAGEAAFPQGEAAFSYGSSLLTNPAPQPTVPPLTRVLREIGGPAPLLFSKPAY
jgi:hypothetical protein